MSETPQETVQQTGAGAGDVLIGINKEGNAGLLVEVLNPQPPRDEGGRITGSFKALAAGNGRYAEGIRTVLSEQGVFRF